MDIGPSTSQAFAQAVLRCKTIFWNGPMGKYEVEAWARGTVAVAQAVAQAFDEGAVTVVGGKCRVCLIG